MTSGIEPATCRFVAWCLNHYATARPNVPLRRNLNFLDRFPEDTQIPNFVNIRPVGAALFHADEQNGQTCRSQQPLFTVPRTRLGLGVLKQGQETSSFSGISGDPMARCTVLPPTVPRVAGGCRHKYLVPAAASGQVANFMRDVFWFMGTF
jgi:hypothetical protein